VSKSSIARLIGFIGTVGAGAALVGAGVTGTGAYFSDSKPGSVAGTTGSIKVTADNAAISFDKMLPGELKTATASYTNSGANVQDVWVVFANDTGFLALNDTGQYSEVAISNAAGEVFHSANLNDNRAGGCAPETGTPVCRALPRQIKLSDSLLPGAGGTMTFDFTPSPRYQFNVANAPLLGLNYKIVATQHGIAPNNVLNKAADQ
jgi:hypothetical protein